MRRFLPGPPRQGSPHFRLEVAFILQSAAVVAKKLLVDDNHGNSLCQTNMSPGR